MKRHQQGMTMLVVLVLLSVMLLGGLALARITETSTLASGNAAFREASLQASEVGLNSAYMATRGIAAASEDTRSFRELLLLYIGEVVEANFQDPTKMAVAVLAEVHSDYFTLVEVAQSKKLHYPIAQVLSAAEVPSTAATGKATLVIEVHRQVFPKGSIGFGFSFPI